MYEQLASHSRTNICNHVRSSFISSDVTLCHWINCSDVLKERSFFTLFNREPKSCRHSSWTALPLKMGPIGFPETSVTNRQFRFVTSQKNEDFYFNLNSLRGGWSKQRYTTITPHVPKTHTGTFRGADKCLARPTSRCILFDGENVSFDVSLVIHTYINSTNIPSSMIIHRIYETQNLLSL
jgi:hypothetical protein